MRSGGVDADVSIGQVYGEPVLMSISSNTRGYTTEGEFLSTSIDDSMLIGCRGRVIVVVEMNTLLSITGVSEKVCRNSTIRCITNMEGSLWIGIMDTNSSILLKYYTPCEYRSSTSPHRDATVLSEEGSGERGGRSCEWSTEGFSGIGMEEVLIWKLKSYDGFSGSTGWSEEIGEVSMKVSSLYFS